MRQFGAKRVRADDVIVQVDGGGLQFRQDIRFQQLPFAFGSAKVARLRGWDSVIDN